MLQQIHHDNGLITLQSPLLRQVGVTHAFTTRVGGASTGGYASLNLAGLEKGDDSDANMAVAENFRRLRAALGCERTMRVAVQQVHGKDVWVPTAKAIRPADAPCADAMVTDQANQLLTIRTADCVPILLASGDGSVVAAVHAGWRGVVAGVVGQTLSEMRERFGVAGGDVVAAVGPHISADYFEVGPEVTVAFDDAELGDAVIRDNGHRPHINLGDAVMLQLARAGVPAPQIDTTDACTYRDDELFYSYRRDGKDTGRMAAVVMCKR